MGVVHIYTLLAKEEDTVIQMQTVAGEDDCIAPTGRDIDVVVVDVDTGLGIPVRNPVVQHQAGVDSPEGSMVRT